jgi:DNA invertase Pin-like site-specific DNA recombinase
MKVVGYLRVSTDWQAEEGLGLDIQERAIRKWAKDNGHTVAGIFRDEGISGSNGLDTRLGLADALDALRDGTASGLVVYRLDRLARDLVLQEQLLGEAWRIGASVFSTSGAEAGYLSDDPNDPSRALIRQVLGAVSQYERSMIALRLRSGRMRKRETGGFIGGTAPLGFRVERRALVPDDEEQRVVERIRQLHLEGKSLREIGKVLDAEGLRPKRGGRWHSTTINRALQRAGL